jgi:hypothetical protein
MRENASAQPEGKSETLVGFQFPENKGSAFLDNFLQCLVLVTSDFYRPRDPLRIVLDE